MSARALNLIMALFWSIVFGGYFLIRDQLSETVLTLLIGGSVLMGLVLLALYFYLHQRFNPKMADYEETDAWFDKTMYAHEARARVLALGFGAFGCMAMAFIWWIL